MNKSTNVYPEEMAGMANTKIGTPARSKSDLLISAVQEVQTVGERVRRLMANLQGQDSPPTQELSHPQCLADLLVSQPEIIREQCQEIHEVLGIVESILL